MSLEELYQALGSDLTALLQHPDLPPKSYRLLGQFVSDLQSELDSDEAERFHAVIAAQNVIQALLAIGASHVGTQAGL